MDTNIKKQLQTHKSDLDLNGEWAKLQNRRKKKKRAIVFFWALGLITLLGSLIFLGKVYFDNKEVNSSSNQPIVAKTESFIEECLEQINTAQVTSTQIPESEEKGLITQELLIDQINQGGKDVSNKINSSKTLPQEIELLDVVDNTDEMLHNVKIGLNKSEHLLEEIQGEFVERAIINAQVLESYTSILESETELIDIQPIVPQSEQRKFLQIDLGYGYHNHDHTLSQLKSIHNMDELSLSTNYYTIRALYSRPLIKDLKYIAGLSYTNRQDQLNVNYQNYNQLIRDNQLVRIYNFGAGVIQETYSQTQVNYSRKLKMDIKNNIYEFSIPIGLEYAMTERVSVSTTVQIPVYSLVDWYSIDQNLAPLKIEEQTLFDLKSSSFLLSARYEFPIYKKSKLYLQADLMGVRKNLDFAGTDVLSQRNIVPMIRSGIKF